MIITDKQNKLNLILKRLIGIVISNLIEFRVKFSGTKHYTKIGLILILRIRFVYIFTFYEDIVVSTKIETFIRYKKSFDFSRN